MNKTIFISAIAVLLAAFAVLSCQREELSPESGKADGAVLMFTSEDAGATKTEWNGSTILWSAGDAISIAYTLDGVWNKSLYASAPLAESASAAGFAVPTGLAPGTDGKLTFYGVYPAVSADFSAAPSLVVTVPSHQIPGTATYDKTADVMVARSALDYKGVPQGEIPMYWERVVAHADLTLSNLALSADETVQTLTLVADSESDLTGRFALNMATAEYSPEGQNANKVTLDISGLSASSAGTLNVWAVMMPCSIASLKVELTTSKAVYVREIETFDSDLTANARNVFTVDMTSARKLTLPEDNDAINTEVFDLLNLDYPGLETVKAEYQAGNYGAAAAALVDYYRYRDVTHPEEVLENRRMYSEDKRIAEQALEHRFCVRRGYWYESVSSDGKQFTYWDFDDEDGRIDWTTELPGAGQETYQRHWHQWFKYLAWSQYLTGDDKYFNSWKEVYSDWLATYPCPERRPNDHLAYDNRSWHQLSTATRISNQLADFPYFITSSAFSGSWMSTFLVEFHKLVEFNRDNFYHEKTSNIYFAQLTAQASAGMLMPEFKLAQQWLTQVASVISSQFTVQFFDDGVHTEMTPNYHLGVLDNFRVVYNIARANGRLGEFDAEYAQKMKNAAIFLANYVWPDYTWEYFNDTFLQTKNVLLNTINRYSALFPDENVLKYLGSDRKEGVEPTESLISFPDGGYHILRSNWKEDGMMLILKNNDNEDNEYHVHLDNGTFGLFNKGRNFLPDPGVYTYGGDDQLDAMRAQFLAASSHNTLTKNLEPIAKGNSRGQCLLTRTSPSEDLVVTQNASYTDLTHRRAVYMLDKELYVIVDEAFGDAADCEVNLSFHLCEGTVVADDYSSSCAYGVHTEFADGNDMLLRTFSETAAGFTAETGISHCSTKMNTFYDRTYYRVTADKTAATDVVRFITVICPGRSAEISASFESAFSQASSSVKVTVNGKSYSLVW